MSSPRGKAAVWGLPGCLGSGSLASQHTHRPAGERDGLEDTGQLSMHKSGGPAAEAQLLLLWPWGGRSKENKSMSIIFACGKGCRWLRVTLQGGTWDLRRFLCLSNENWVRAECVPKQKLLVRMPAEAGKALLYQAKTDQKVRTPACKTRA